MFIHTKHSLHNKYSPAIDVYVYNIQFAIATRYVQHCSTCSSKIHLKFVDSIGSVGYKIN